MYVCIKTKQQKVNGNKFKKQQFIVLCSKHKTSTNSNWKIQQTRKRSNNPTYIMQVMGLMDKSIPNSQYVNNKCGGQGQIVGTCVLSGEGSHRGYCID